MIDPERIWSSNQLPTLPSVAIRLLEISKNPDTEIREVIDVIKADPAITAKILKSTNSSFFGFSSKVTSIDRAVPLLGTTVVTSLALSFSLVEAAMTKGPLAEHYSSYWKQSVVQGVAAQLLGELSRDGLDCEYFLAGLLADLGRLAMLKTISKDYLPVLETARDERRPLLDVEREILDVDHVTVGVKLMEHWQLPESLIKAARLHHASLDVLRQVADDEDFGLVKSVATAATIGEYFCTTNTGPALESLKTLVGEFYGITDSDLNDLIVKARERFDDAGDVFSVATDSIADPSDLMAEASEHLAQLAVREHVASTQATARQELVEREKQQLQATNQKLRKQALYDPLTAVYNRHFFDETLNNEIERARRSAGSLGVIFTDIDRFKQLNDTCGHQFGDQVLARVAKVCGRALRASDVLARYGGEEFVILLVQPTEKGLAKVAERIRASVEAEEIIFDGKRIPVTISVGAVLAIPSRNDDDDLSTQLIAAADEAMYDSKENGRNQVHARSLLSEQDRQLARMVTSCRFSRWLVNCEVLDIATASKALLKCDTPWVRIGVMAQQHGCLDALQVDQILQDQEQSNQRFGEIALRLGLLDEMTLAQLLSLQQEDPATFGQTLVCMGILDRTAVDALVTAYFAEIRPKLAANVERQTAGLAR